MTNKYLCDDVYVASQEEISPQVSVGVPVESTSEILMLVVTLASVKEVTPAGNKELSMDSVLVDVIKDDGQHLSVRIVDNLSFNYEPGSVFVMHLVSLGPSLICSKFCCIG